MTPPVVTTYEAVAADHVWRYLDDGSDLGTAWRAPGFSDDGWASGTGQFGYGDGDETTVVDDGPDQDRHITTYFRTTFDVASAAAVTALEMDLIRDDGVIVYINGVEVYRDNLPSGAIDSATLAVDGISGAAEDAWLTSIVATDALVDGTNVIAVEIHQKHRTSSDISFHLTLTANP